MTAHKPSKRHPWARWQPSPTRQQMDEERARRLPDEDNPLTQRQARRVRPKTRSPK